MVAIAFAVAAPSLGLAGAGIGTGAAIAGVAIGLLAAYVDSTVVYPALFGKKAGSKPDSLEGFQISTTDPGAPRWDVYGSRAWVPCHYLWTLGVEQETSGGGTGKGARPQVTHVRADVGLALCDGPVQDIVDLYADERAFWSKQFNRVALEDFRWSITAGTGAWTGKLVIQATDFDATDFAGIFSGNSTTGDLVKLERVSPSSLQGFYRIYAVGAHTGTVKSHVVLTPLQGQTPAAGDAASIFDPPLLRRIDQGAASEEWQADMLAGPELVLSRVVEDGVPDDIPPVHIPYDPPTWRSRWVYGGVYRFTGWNEGLWRCTGTNHTGPGAVTPPGFFGQGWIKFVPLPGATTSDPPPTGTSTNPLIICRAENGGFVFFDSVQSSQEYRGTQTQDQDPTFALYEPDPPAHRGIAHVSLTRWTLAPHGNIIPRVTGMVRARPETVGSAIRRICEKAMTPEAIDVSRLRAKPLLGYSVPGGTTVVQAIQPLLTAHGICVQDRGGVLTFLDRRDLPVVPVATRHLNARPTTEQTTRRGLTLSRIDDADIPERVLVQYLDPAEGANEAEGDGRRAPDDPDRGGSDTLDVNLKPLVLFGYEAKKLARQLRHEIQLETHRGQVVLPPGYMDVLPGHCITTQSNDQDFDQAPAGTTIDYTTRLRDLLPGSVRVQVRFANGQVATLLDDENGALVGFPAGITASTNTVDYATGEIELETSVDLDDRFAPLIEYRYERQLLLRANKATLGGYDFTVACDLITTSTDEPLPPVPRRINSGLGAAIATDVPEYRTEILDIPGLHAGMANAVWLGFVAAPDPGGTWRGATVYQSPNGVDRWAAVGTIQQPSVIGTAAGSVLPNRASGGQIGIVDWSNELVVDLPNGETLDSYPTEALGGGLNWALVGDEIIGFHEAEAGDGTTWTLRGLWRGRRLTLEAMDNHVDGERFVLLFGLGQTHGLLHDLPGGYGAAQRDYHWRIVPGGAAITAATTQTRSIIGESCRPPSPLLLQDDVTQAAAGEKVHVRWWRRSREQPALFGPAILPFGWVEKYEVIAFDAATAVGLIVGGATIAEAIEATKKRRWSVGDEKMGTPNAPDSIDYGTTDITGDGFFLGITPIGFAVRQIGPAAKSEWSLPAFFLPT